MRQNPQSDASSNHGSSSSSSGLGNEFCRRGPSPLPSNLLRRRPPRLFRRPHHRPHDPQAAPAATPQDTPASTTPDAQQAPGTAPVNGDKPATADKNDKKDKKDKKDKDKHDPTPEPSRSRAMLRPAA